MKKEFIFSFLVSGVLGALIWLFSPYVTGVIEPWDSKTPYYFICLFSAGFITGILIPHNFWPILLGVVSGQLFYMLVFLPAGSLGPLIVIGIVAMFAYGISTLVGAFLGTRTRSFVKEYLAGTSNRA